MEQTQSFSVGSLIYIKRSVCLCLNPPSICMHIHVEKYILNVRKVVNS